MIQLVQWYNSAPLIRRHTRFCARYKCLTLHYITWSRMLVIFLIELLYSGGECVVLLDTELWITRILLSHSNLGCLIYNEIRSDSPTTERIWSRSCTYAYICIYILLIHSELCFWVVLHHHHPSSIIHHPSSIIIIIFILPQESQVITKSM